MQRRQNTGSHNNHKLRRNTRQRKPSGSGRGGANYGALRNQLLDRAKDALASGDRILAENHLQHAEHCSRMLDQEGALVHNDNVSAKKKISPPNNQTEGENEIATIDTSICSPYQPQTQEKEKVSPDQASDDSTEKATDTTIAIAS